jgi:DNA-binding LacI/PurR family transcriptional regulator/anti-anti-sigma regulatory factor
MLLTGIQRAAREHNARLVVFHMTTDAAMRDLPLWQCVDGWVVSYSNLNNLQFSDGKRPFVMISQAVEGAPVVVIDNRNGMRAVVAHLLELGYRRVAFVGWQENPDYAERLAGYREALDAYQVAFDPELVMSIDQGDVASGERLAESFDLDHLSFDAVAFMTDNLALGALSALTRAGVRIPEQLAITGFDDIPEAQIAIPPLTTVRMRFDAMIGTATEHLLDILAGAQPARDPIVIPTVLVVRRSSGAYSALPGSAATVPIEAERRQHARVLAEIVGSPQKLALDESPARLWPGVDTIITTINAVLDGSPLPSDAELQLAWLDAVNTASYADPLEEVLERIEAILAHALSSLALDDPAHRRARLAVRQLRTALLRVAIGAQVQRTNRSEAALSFSDRAARVLADRALEEVFGLDWLAGSNVSYAALALWDEGDAGRQLRLVGRYPAALDGPPVPLARFPSPEIFEGADGAPVVVLPLQSVRREWGFLALAMPDDLSTAAFDSSPLLAALLTARIDSGMLQRERESQQNMLLSAFDRERALADTVRELGCPIIPVSSTVLLVPLIGVIDTMRAQQIIGDLLRAIEVNRAREILLDVTGVPLIDTHVAGVLIQLSQMSRLLGARTRLVGVRPEIAQSIVSLGVDLRGLSSYTSLTSAMEALGAAG